MAIPEQEAPQERKKRTVWLLAAGTVSLLIPLGGAVYLHWSQNAGAAGPSGRNDVFERRDGDDRKITPTQTAVVMSPSALTTPPPSGLISGIGAKPAGSGSSLDFVQSNADMQARVNDSKAAVAAIPAASTAPAAPAAAAPVAASAAKTKVKPGKKAFTMPKLQPSRGFTSMGSTGAQGAANGAQNGAAGAQTGAAGGAPPVDMSDPRVQAYLKAHQGQ